MLPRATTASLVVALLASCGERPCPECPARPLESGTYTASSAGPMIYGTTPLPPALSGDGPYTVTVDVARRLVTRRYFHGGDEVIETWSIAHLTCAESP